MATGGLCVMICGMMRMLQSYVVNLTSKRDVITRGSASIYRVMKHAVNEGPYEEANHFSYTVHYTVKQTACP